MLPLIIPYNDGDNNGNDNGENGLGRGGECWLRVAGEKIKLMEGKCVVFDDSFEHEAGFDVFSSSSSSSIAAQSDVSDVSDISDHGCAFTVEQP